MWPVARLLQRARPAWAERPVVPLVAGLLLYVILRSIPGLGTLVGWLVVLLALGALWEWGRATLQRIRPTPRADSRVPASRVGRAVGRLLTAARQSNRSQDETEIEAARDSGELVLRQVIDTVRRHFGSSSRRYGTQLK